MTTEIKTEIIVVRCTAKEKAKIKANAKKYERGNVSNYLIKLGINPNITQ